ncbi:MAG: BatD family protein [Rikenellaceae bacterium]
MRKFFLSLLLLINAFIALGADNVTFEALSPRTVAVGERFRVEFSLNAKPDGGFTKAPSFDGFTVIAGPTTSQSQSISYVNGSMSQTSNFTYTYVLSPTQAGVFTLPEASISVDGKSYSSNKMVIEVVNDGSNSGGNNSGGGGTSASTSSQSQGTIASDDILVRVVANKTDVYKGEPINVKVTLYTRVTIRGIESSKLPSFNGFWTKDLNVDRYQPTRTTIDGKVYDSRIIREYIIYPQQSGTLHIEQLSMAVVAQIVSQSSSGNSMFDNFFGGPTVQEVRKNISSLPITINVKDFPAGAPASFSGAVGTFSIDSDIASTELTANASTKYTLQINGSGNLPLIQAPALELPNSMEQYNIKTTESLQTTSSGISGYRSFEYPFIPRSEGNYTIPEINFSYFDPSKDSYVTLNTPAYDITVLADSTQRGVGSGGMISGISREELKILDQDIRFIKLGSPRLVARNDFFISSWSYYLALLMVTLLSCGGYFYLRRLLSQRKNVAFIKNKKANQVALQRLKVAAKSMNEGNERIFYQEMLKALWGYMSDKLNIPVSNLTKDNIRESLSKRGLTNDNASKFIDIISECEYAQYSPQTSGKMNEIYDSAVAMLSKFESLIKK